jgi:hypothetical protein
MIGWSYSSRGRDKEFVQICGEISCEWRFGTIGREGEMTFRQIGYRGV